MQGAPLLLGELQQPLHDLVENKVAVIRPGSTPASSRPSRRIT